MIIVNKIQFLNYFLIQLLTFQSLAFNLEAEGTWLFTPLKSTLSFSHVKDLSNIGWIIFVHLTIQLITLVHSSPHFFASSQTSAVKYYSQNIF